MLFEKNRGRLANNRAHPTSGSERYVPIDAQKDGLLKGEATLQVLRGPGRPRYTCLSNVTVTCDLLLYFHI